MQYHVTLAEDFLGGGTGGKKEAGQHKSYHSSQVTLGTSAFFFLQAEAMSRGEQALYSSVLLLAQLLLLLSAVPIPASNTDLSLLVQTLLFVSLQHFTHASQLPPKPILTSQGQADLILRNLIR